MVPGKQKYNVYSESCFPKRLAATQEFFWPWSLPSLTWNQIKGTMWLYNFKTLEQEKKEVDWTINDYLIFSFFVEFLWQLDLKQYGIKHLPDDINKGKVQEVLRPFSIFKSKLMASILCFACYSVVGIFTYMYFLSGLCSKRAQWPLAPNFCSQAPRISAVTWRLSRP